MIQSLISFLFGPSLPSITEIDGLTQDEQGILSQEAEDLRLHTDMCGRRYNHLQKVSHFNLRMSHAIGIRQARLAMVIIVLLAVMAVGEAGIAKLAAGIMS